MSSLPIVIALITAVVIIWLVVYMRAQRPVTNAQQLIQQNRYAEAVGAVDRLLAANPTDAAAHLHRAEALKLMGRFDDAIASYRRSDDPAAREGVALCLAHLGRDLDEAKRLMDETIALHPQIQEFQALNLSYVLLRRGDRDAALRTFRDNLELLETRFRDDYTDPDPLLAETLWIFAKMLEETGDADAAALLRERAAQWAPGSVWAR